MKRLKKFKWQNLERSIPEASPGSLKSVELVNQIRRYLRFRTNEMLEKKKLLIEFGWAGRKDIWVEPHDQWSKYILVRAN